MELNEAIRNRRSVRKYKGTPLPVPQIRNIVRAGMDAPSAGNLQSRYFYIVTDPSLKGRLASSAFDQNFIAEAPVAIVVCADLRIKKEYGTRGEELYAPMDCAAAIQNMMLTAHADGCGTCWVGAFDEKRIADLMGIPDHLRPIAIIALGVPDETPAPPARPALEQLCEFV
jgi:nitroreductase